MKKKIISVVLAVIALLSCICFTAYADDVKEYSYVCDGTAHASIQLPEPIEIPYEPGAHGSSSLKTAKIGEMDNAALLFALEQEIKDAILAGKSSIDIASYNINPDDINLRQLEYYSPYFGDGISIYAYYTSGASGSYYVRLEIASELSPAEAAAYFADVDREVNKITALVSQAKTELDKAIILHDYLVYTAAYDMSYYEGIGAIPDVSYKSAGVIVKHVGVCNSYAYAYMYILNRVGIECHVTSSNDMNHAWNIVKIGGKYYHVDVTWDDPVPDSLGRVYHSNFLLSDGAIGTRRGGSTQYHYGWDRTDLVCSDTSYDSAYWTEVDSNIVTVGDYSYFISGGCICLRDSTDNVTIDLVGLGLWKTWSGSGWWIGTFSGMSLQGRDIYYNTSTEIRKVNIDTLEDTLVYAPDLSEGYIYGNAIVGSTLNYLIKKDANEIGLIRSIELQGVHTHSYSAQVVAPGCEYEGFTLYTCVCGDSAKKDHVEPLGHLWDEGTVILEPTESSEGELRYSCERCGGTKTESIPVLTHTHNYEFFTVTDPNCTDDGYVTHTCACGESFIDSVIPALGHKWDEGTVTKEPTQDSEGVMTYICEICGELMTETIKKLDHIHSYVSVVTEPTCTDEGFTSYSCACGDSYVGEYVDPIGHSWTEWDQVKAPTVDEEGEEARNCKTCGIVEGRPVEKLPEPINNPFADVAERDYFYEPVMWAISRNVTTGLSATSFGPTVGCTRAQVVTFLWRAAGEPQPKSDDNPFKDVNKGQYYYDAVLWAVENGITTGLSADAFGPNAGCNRAQIVTFLWRAQEKPEPQSSGNPFTDVAEGAYYYDAVLWAVEKGVTTGMSAASFAPDASCTRGQIVTFLYRAYE